MKQKQIDLRNHNEIGKLEFAGNKDIQLLIIPSNVKKIGDHAFDGCSTLKYLIIEEGVEYIGKFAFNNCDNLEIINLPKSLIKVDRTAFGATWVADGPFDCKQVGGCGNIKAMIFNGTRDEYYDATGNAIINVFKNCETHTYIQRYSDDCETWGSKRTHKYDGLPF